MDPITNQSSVPAPKKSYGAAIGIVVIILVLIVGALYFWGEKMSATDEAAVTTEAQTETPVSSSDDASSIEADLKATDIETTEI
jgi:hypothetical protein